MGKNSRMRRKNTGMHLAGNNASDLSVRTGIQIIAGRVVATKNDAANAM